MREVYLLDESLLTIAIRFHPDDAIYAIGIVLHRGRIGCTAQLSLRNGDFPSPGIQPDVSIPVDNGDLIFIAPRRWRWWLAGRELDVEFLMSQRKRGDPRRPQTSN